MAKTILAVDDEIGFRDLYTYMLTPLGFEVTCAEDGLQAIQKIQERAYDLVLMDIHMPRMTGPEALKKIKSLRPNQKVIIFSSSSDPERHQEKQAEKEGVVECLFKPVEDQEIRRVLKKALSADFND